MLLICGGCPNALRHRISVPATAATVPFAPLQCGRAPPQSVARCSFRHGIYSGHWVALYIDKRCPAGCGPHISFSISSLIPRAVRARVSA